MQDIYYQKLKSIHQELTIPEDYLENPALPIQYEATVLTDITSDLDNSLKKIAPNTAGAWTLMKEAARKENIILLMFSAFRGIDYQKQLILNKLQKGLRIEDILKVLAAPGFSEHHTGRALDITTTDCPPAEECFDQTLAFKWLSENAKHFNFTLSYPKNNPYKIIYEPWHWLHAQ